MKYILSKIFIISILLQGCFDFGTNDKHNESEEPLRLLWSFSYEGESGYSVSSLQPELIGEESVLISPDRILYRIRQEDGSVEWKVSVVDSSMISAERLLFDSQFIYVKADLRKKIRALRLENGQMEWESKLPENANPFYDLNTDAMNLGELYLTGRYGNMYVFNKQGMYLSSHQFAPSLQGLATWQNKLYIAQGLKPDSSEGHVGRILALNPTTWDTVWTYQTNEGGFYYTSAIIQNGMYYNGTAEGPGGSSLWMRPPDRSSGNTKDC